MALKATIFKAELQISDLHRQYYQTHALTLARHPSETDERMMLRLLAYALFADEKLEFTRGLSSAEEPDLWLKNDTGEIELWIELGQPDSKRLRKASGRAKQVVVINYGGRSADIWWQSNAESIQSLDKVSVLNMPVEQSTALAGRVQRNMHFNITLDGTAVYWADSDECVECVLDCRQGEFPFA